MLFDRRHKKKVETLWKIVVIIMVLGMILLYLPLSK